MNELTKFFRRFLAIFVFDLHFRASVNMNIYVIIYFYET